MALYRFRTAAIVGEWRPTRRDACEEAIRLCLARRDHTEPDGIRWVVPAEIESEGGSAETDDSPAFEARLSRRRA